MTCFFNDIKMSLQIFNGLLLSLVVALYVSCSLRIWNVNASLQQVTFFDNLGCSGDRNVTFTTTQTGLNSTWIANASSVHILGVWSISIEKVVEDGVVHRLAAIQHNTKPPMGLCNEPGPDWGLEDPENYVFISAERKGPADMTTSQIIFYTKIGFSGIGYKFDQGETEKLPSGPVEIKSVIKFSNDSWTVYPEANFKGKAMHFRPVRSDASEDYFELTDSVISIVGSIKKGIHDEENDKATGCTQTVNVMLLQMSFLTFVCKF